MNIFEFLEYNYLRRNTHLDLIFIKQYVKSFTKINFNHTLASANLMANRLNYSTFVYLGKNIKEVPPWQSPMAI